MRKKEPLEKFGMPFRKKVLHSIDNGMECRQEAPLEINVSLFINTIGTKSQPVYGFRQWRTNDSKTHYNTAIIGRLRHCNPRLNRNQS